MDQNTGESVSEVSVASLSDSDLDAGILALSRGDAEDDVEEEKEDGEEDQETKKAQDKGSEDGEAAEEDNQPLNLTRSQLDKLVSERVAEETARLSKRVKDGQDYIRERNKEIGTLRQQLQEYKGKLESALSDDNFFENPGQAARAAAKLEDLDKDIDALDREEQQINLAHQTYSYVAQHVDLNKVPVEDVRASLKAVGAEDSYIEEFIQNPYDKASGDGLIWFFRHVQAESALRKLVPLAQHMHKLLKSKDVDEAKKGERILSKIAEASRNAGQVTGSSGNSRGARRGAQLSEVEVARLSEAELDEAIANLA